MLIFLTFPDLDEAALSQFFSNLNSSTLRTIFFPHAKQFYSIPFIFLFLLPSENLAHLHAINNKFSNWLQSSILHLISLHSVSQHTVLLCCFLLFCHLHLDISKLNFFLLMNSHYHQFSGAIKNPVLQWHCV